MSLVHQLLTWNQSSFCAWCRLSQHFEQMLPPSEKSLCLPLLLGCAAILLQCSVQPDLPTRWGCLCEQAQGRGGNINLARSRRVAITPFCIDLQLDQLRQTVKSHLQISIKQFCLQLLPCHTCEVVGTINCPLPVCASHSSSPLHWVPLDSVTSLSMVETGKSLRSFSFLGFEHFDFFFPKFWTVLLY